VTCELAPLRVALAVEGKTDGIILKELIASIVSPRPVTVSFQQPEFSVAFDQLNEDCGWRGVYEWCHDTATPLHGEKGVEDNMLFLNHDVLVVQIDADVASSTYESAHIPDPMGDLPCVSSKCPPIQPTIDALTLVLQRWLSIDIRPSNTVFCIPAQSLEAWLLAALYPTDKYVINGGIECREDPERLLSGKPKVGRLVSGRKKKTEVYESRAGEFSGRWSVVVQLCSQAMAFEKSFKEAIRA